MQLDDLPSDFDFSMLAGDRIVRTRSQENREKMNAALYSLA